MLITTIYKFGEAGGKLNERSNIIVMVDEALDGRTLEPRVVAGCARASVSSYRWQPHCRGLYQTPMAA